MTARAPPNGTIYTHGTTPYIPIRAYCRHWEALGLPVGVWTTFGLRDSGVSYGCFLAAESVGWLLVTGELPAEARWFVRISNHLGCVTALLCWALPIAATIALLATSQLKWWKCLVVGFLLFVGLQMSFDAMRKVYMAAAGAALSKGSGTKRAGMWFLVFVMLTFYVVAGVAILWILLSDWSFTWKLVALAGLSIGGYLFKEAYNLFAIAVISRADSGGPPEVTAAMAVLTKLEESHDPIAFGIVRERVEGLIRSDPNAFAGIIQRGRPVKHWVLSAVANTAANALESGEFHIHRGTLDPLVGDGLLRIFDRVVDEAIQIGVMEAEYGIRQKEAVRDNIEFVG